ncbi:MAG: ABC transporter ATP-binding protein [Pseudomonadota bacterium]|nr:ABC transporter ATP-binding protein [Pseudomonadota bacterium]
MLKVDNLSVSYGAVKAVRHVSFDVPKGKIVTLIGANGAGKTSVLRSISGLVKPEGGQIIFKNHLITKLKAHEIVRIKITHVPEGRGIFLNLTVEENLDLGAWTAPDKNSLKADLDYVFELFPRLKERLKQNSGTLSGGELQMLAIGRALMSHPELLLLDEPSLGLAPQMIQRIFEIVQKINSQGTTILLVEQNALQALRISHFGVVLETGTVLLKGEAKDILKSDQVKKAYLGE